MKQKFLILLSGLFLLLFYCKNNVNYDKKLISVEEMEELAKLEDVQLVDVRTPSEYSEGYIANAQNIDFWNPNFNERIETLDKTKPVVVYCKSGGRSAKCASQLKSVGFKIIYDLEGGFSQWKKKGMPVEK